MHGKLQQDPRTERGWVGIASNPSHPIHPYHSVTRFGSAVRIPAAT
jgi:hypothetical protein